MSASFPSSSSSSFMPWAPTSTSTQTQRRTLSARGQIEWPDLPPQVEADVEAMVFMSMVQPVWDHQEESCAADALTLYDEDDDMDLWGDDDEFLERERDILLGAGVEESTTLSSMESLIDDATSTSTLDFMSVSSLSSSTDHIPAREETEEYNDSINFLYQSLAVACIMIESYLTAYHRAYPLAQFENIVIHRPLPRYTNPTLIEYVLRGPVNLIPLSDLQDIYGIQFPDTSTPPPPMPESFTLTPPDWAPPPRPKPQVSHHTRGSRPVDEALEQGPDWIRLVKIKLLLDTYFNRSQGAETAVNSNEPVQAAPVSLDHLNDIRKAKRVIKPLPKRTNHIVGNGQQQQQSTGGLGMVPFVGSALGAALWNVGEAVVGGVKRLRDEFEEGGFGGRWKKMRID